LDHRGSKYNKMADGEEFHGIRFSRRQSGIYAPETETQRAKPLVKVQTDWTVLLTQSFLTAFTLLLLAKTAFIATKQWKEMVTATGVAQQSADTQAKTLKISQRAWLVPSGAEMEKPEANKDFRIWQLIPNNGPTPAKNATFLGTFCKWFDEGKGAKNRRCEKLPSSKKGVLIRSGGGYKIPFHWFEVSDSMVIDEKSVRDMQLGYVYMKIYGTVWYDDIFDHHHWVNFCSEYAWDERQFMTCSSGIEMDDDPE
jgi:hypothetical protein